MIKNDWHRDYLIKEILKISPTKKQIKGMKENYIDGYTKGMEDSIEVIKEIYSLHLMS